jgi:hypothetical protein
LATLLGCLSQNSGRGFKEGEIKPRPEGSVFITLSISSARTGSKHHLLVDAAGVPENNYFGGGGPLDDGLALPAAFAASPSQQDCEAQGGTFTKSGGQVKCVIVGEGKNPKFTDTETTTGNKQQSDECAGTGSGKCPPGQF